MAIRRTFAAVALLIVLCALHPVRAAAQGPASPEALQAANELFAILSKDMMAQVTEQMTGRMWPLLERQLRAGAKIDDVTLTQLRAEFLRIQRDNVTELMKDAPAIYARHFTAPELRELATFYRSPTGTKALRELPQITAELFERMSPRLEAAQKQTADAFAKILRERGYR